MENISSKRGGFLLQKMKRLDDIIKEIKVFVKSEFRYYFTIIYGSYPYGVNTSNSDLDFVTVCENFNDINLKNTLDFALNLYDRYELVIDDEVPHERKLLATYETIEKAIQGYGFEKRNGRIYVPPIVKTREFLESDKLVMRLLLNAITSKNIFVSGDKDYYLNMREKSLENMIGFMFSINDRDSFTIPEFVQSLIGTPERNGEMYLGYKDKPAVREYLAETFRRKFEKLTKGGIFKKEKERYYLLDHEWLNQLTHDKLIQKYINFGSNTNPLGPPSKVLEILYTDLEGILSSYPGHGNKEAIKEFSNFYDVPEETLAIGNGSTEFFFVLPKALDITEGIVIIPTFWEYDFSLKRLNRNVKYFKTSPKEGFQINFSNLEDVISAMSEEGGNIGVYICNPNNPTSTLVKPDHVLNLCEKFREVKFIIDETYLLFRTDYDNLSLMRRAHQYPNIVVVTSFSKFFTLPGVRIGVCASNKQNIDFIQQQQIPYGVNTIAQKIIPYLIADKEFIESSRRYMDNERGRVYELLKAKPHLHPYKPQANFVLVELKDEYVDSTTLCDHLKRNGLTIRNGSEFRTLGNKYIRFSIKTKEENELLLNKISEFYNLNSASFRE